jgi:hypothetical protein
MKDKKIAFLGFILIFMSSCTDFLEPYPNGDISGEDIWNYQDKVQGLIGACYDNMPTNYDNNEGAYLDCATDNAVATSTSNDMSKWALGTITTGNDIFATYWTRDYKSINLVNTFLKDRRGYNTRFLTNLANNEILRNRLQGEAFALRAWFQWDLLQKFGGKGRNGIMLGFPIVLQPLGVDLVDLPRNTYEECVQQIVSDCDSAYKYLPIAHRDFISKGSYSGGKYWGRMDGITMIAIKANVYLTWASPRFNPANIAARWDSAAVNAKKVMDFKTTTDAITGGFVIANKVDWFNPNFPGIVFASRFSTTSDAMERMFYPGGFQGDGKIGASQELVDAFPMRNGYPIKDKLNRGGYNPDNPYAGRDSLFYSVIFHNGAKAVKANTALTMYTFDSYVGGKDAAGLTSNSRTNYYIKKFVWMGLNWADGTAANKQPHSKFFIRWAHMVLTFAEAANQSEGPNGSKFGLSAKDAIKYLRTRKNYDGKLRLLAADPYLEEMANFGKDSLSALIKNERRIETCFEGMRFYDLRRWSTDVNSLKYPASGMQIVKVGTNPLIYTPVEVEKRDFKSAYLPIPYSEVLKMKSLVQNEGWDGWN